MMLTIPHHKTNCGTATLANIITSMQRVDALHHLLTSFNSIYLHPYSSYLELRAPLPFVSLEESQATGSIIYAKF